MRKVVIASDSFKGCLSSLQVAQAVAAGVHSVFPHCETIGLQLADGGEGTLSSLASELHAVSIHKMVSDPLFRPILSEYAICSPASIPTAIIEMASASGLTLLSEGERNPMLTSSYGTGELILDALEKGCRHFLIGIGGSATNDCGLGMLSALGYRFYDSHGSLLNGVGENLSEVTRIDDQLVHPGLSDSTFTVACDVDNPLSGPEGAAFVFAPQKGATPAMVEALDMGSLSFSKVVSRQYGKEMQHLSGGGAAGGLGAALATFLDARLVSGIELVLDAVGFDRHLQGADLVITGEGRFDGQTAKGKVPDGVMRRCARYGVPVVVFAGSVSPEADMSGFEGVFQVSDPSVPLEQSMRPEIALANISSAVRKALAK